jgi:hypothetical protein
MEPADFLTDRKLLRRNSNLSDNFHGLSFGKNRVFGLSHC